MDAKLKDMRKESRTMDAKIIIGKNGLTDAVIKNIKQELIRNRIVKLKILSSYISDKDKNEVFDAIAAKTEAKIVHKIGFTIALSRR